MRLWNCTARVVLSEIFFMKTESDTLLGILFENRNKAYGAYELRTHYQRRLVRSFFFAIGITVFIFLVIPLTINWILHHPKTADPFLPETAYVIERTLEFEKPEQPKGSVAPMKSNPADAPIRVVDDVQVKPEPAEPQVPNEDPGDDQPNPGTSLTALPATGGGGHSADSASDEILSAAVVDIAPEFPGGEEALLNFLGRNLQYPSIPREAGISGRVYVSFVVNETGGIDNISVIRKLGYGFDEEVVRVLHRMPPWKPGVYKNKNVKTMFYLPVSFQLK